MAPLEHGWQQPQLSQACTGGKGCLRGSSPMPSQGFSLGRRNHVTAICMSGLKWLVKARNQASGKHLGCPVMTWRESHIVLLWVKQQTKNVEHQGCCWNSLLAQEGCATWEGAGASMALAYTWSCASRELGPARVWGQLDGIEEAPQAWTMQCHTTGDGVGATSGSLPQAVSVCPAWAFGTVIAVWQIATCQVAC